MSDTVDNGGPAFPVPPDQLFEIGDRSQWLSANPGMSLRDWFAGQALQGWLASYPESGFHPVKSGNLDEVASEAYAMADAMLRARSKKGATP